VPEDIGRYDFPAQGRRPGYGPVRGRAAAQPAAAAAGAELLPRMGCAIPHAACHRGSIHQARDRRRSPGRLASAPTSPPPPLTSEGGHDVCTSTSAARAWRDRFNWRGHAVGRLLLADPASSPGHSKSTLTCRLRLCRPKLLVSAVQSVCELDLQLGGTGSEYRFPARAHATHSASRLLAT